MPASNKNTLIKYNPSDQLKWSNFLIPASIHVLEKQQSSMPVQVALSGQYEYHDFLPECETESFFWHAELGSTGRSS